MRVLDIKSKIKLNQHRPEAHPKMYDFYSSGNEQEKSLANWMSRLGLKVTK